MKVLLINGSPRKQGNTFLALSEVAKTLEVQGIESEIVQIGNKAVRGCIACGQCQMKLSDKELLKRTNKNKYKVMQYSREFIGND